MFLIFFYAENLDFWWNLIIKSSYWNKVESKFMLKVVFCLHNFTNKRLELPHFDQNIHFKINLAWSRKVFPWDSNHHYSWHHDIKRIHFWKGVKGEFKLSEDKNPYKNHILKIIWWRKKVQTKKTALHYFLFWIFCANFYEQNLYPHFFGNFL